MLLGITDPVTYLPLAVILMAVVGFSVMNLVLTRILGPNRAGETKALTYESGMEPVGTARKRFNIRFYLIAMVFLVFDVEVVFLYPWATTFANLEMGSTDRLVWLARIFFFLFTTVVAFLYGLRKGVFRFD